MAKRKNTIARVIAPDHIKEAIALEKSAEETIERLLLSDSAKVESKSELTVLFASYLNIYGWFLVTGKQGAAALSVLRRAFELRDGGQVDFQRCSTDNDKEIAHILQNMADAENQLGEYADAMSNAKSAIDCRENLGELLDAYQARKTLGLTLIGMGRIEEGKRELTRYVAAMKKALDDNVLPGDLLSARMNGEDVLIDRWIDVSKVTEGMMNDESEGK